MLLFRRFPGYIYNHIYMFCSLVVLLVVIIYVLFNWGLICTNWEPWGQVKVLCKRYLNGEVVGDLCRPMCVDRSVDSFSCHAFHAGKEAVFSALYNDRRIVIKSANQEVPHDIFFWIDHSPESYPTEDEFVRMIQHRVNSRLNITISKEEAVRLSAFASGAKAGVETGQRHAEMREIWRLLQDNEYLLSSVYLEKDIFPQVIGSCGQYFAVEYLHPAMSGKMATMLSEESGDASWASRVSLGMLLLDLIEEIDGEGLVMCDVKPSHFGLSTSSGRVKLLDLDVTFPKVIADTITGDGRSCTSDNDCSLFDCKSRCEPKTKLCDGPIVTNNLQILCEKIFVGWGMMGGMMVPGLLMTTKSPSSLTAILRQCSLSGSSDQHNKDRLFNTLSELDRILSTQLSTTT